LRKLLLSLCVITLSFYAQSQDILSEGQLHGDFLIDAQYYMVDSAINAQVLPQEIGMNAYGNFNYTNGNFKAGARLESY
jgi:hypothetical protein